MCVSFGHPCVWRVGSRQEPSGTQDFSIAGARYVLGKCLLDPVWALDGVVLPPKFLEDLGCSACFRAQVGPQTTTMATDSEPTGEPPGGGASDVSPEKAPKVASGAVDAIDAPMAAAVDVTLEASGAGGGGTGAGEAIEGAGGPGLEGSSGRATRNRKAPKAAPAPPPPPPIPTFSLTLEGLKGFSFPPPRAGLTEAPWFCLLADRLLIWLRTDELPVDCVPMPGDVADSPELRAQCCSLV